jgi:hypothetical protein
VAERQQAFLPGAAMQWLYRSSATAGLEGECVLRATVSTDLGYWKFPYLVRSALLGGVREG